MTTEAPSSLMGLPIIGNPQIGSKNTVEQWDEAEFAKLINAVFVDPDIKAVAWSQYTPYFNDGDICEFGIGEAVAIKDASFSYETQWGNYPAYTVTTVALDDESCDVVITDAVVEGGFAYNGSALEESQSPAAAAFITFVKSLGHFEHLAYTTFGDHCVVVAFRDRFVIEEYEHE